MFRWPLLFCLLAAVLAAGCGRRQGEGVAIFRDGGFALYGDSLVFPGGRVVALSPLKITVAGDDSVSGWSAASVQSGFPRYESEQTLIDALYNRSAASLARGGRFGADQPTRMLCAAMSLALVDPDRTLAELRRDISGGTVSQNPGVGGSWPVMTDRMLWIPAAWELFKTTGDSLWLAEIAAIAPRVTATDRAVLLDEEYGLFHGAAVASRRRNGWYFPGWMEPADIYAGFSLSTNVAAVAANRAAAGIARAAAMNPAGYESAARELSAAVNERFWIPEKGFYSGLLYGAPYPLQAPLTDNLSQAVAILEGVATEEMSRSILSRSPQYPTNIPRFYPELPDTASADAPYSAMTQAMWLRAAASKSNRTATERALAGAVIHAALSPDSLPGEAEAAAFVSIVLRGLLGIETEGERMVFNPVIPRSMPGRKSLSGLRYRRATLDISVSGTGDRIANFRLDGVTTHRYSIPDTISGSHSVEITLADNRLDSLGANIVDPHRMPPLPAPVWSDPCSALLDTPKGLSGYMVYLNNDLREERVRGHYEFFDARNFTTVTFVPVDSAGTAGFGPRPTFYFPRESTFSVPASRFDVCGTDLVRDRNLAGTLIESDTTRNARLTFDVVVSQPGDYFVDIRYSNGAGPQWCGSECATRLLTVNGQRAGTLVMPQRGTGRWESFGMSNPVSVRLNRGRNTVVVEYPGGAWHNMAGGANRVLIDYVRFIRR
ncbi:MAG: hypothetical protein NC336_04975 [Clostridium sp.]|nr:hypothetical protein [Clostridium sp.]